MTQDMKKNTILHKIGQLIVPLKRTVSPLEADSHSAPGGHFFNRSLLLLLMMTVGVSEMWGAFTEGLYYIKSNQTPAYYLCPSIGCYYGNNVDQPHLTTFKTDGDQYSIWKIVPTGETDTYYIIHYKTGRYLKSNEDFTTVEKGATKNNRKAVHLEVKPETLTDDFKFLINNNSSPYQIYPKVYWNTDVANMSFNPTNEHQDCYAPADGAVENGGAKGMIGLYKKGDNFSKWQIIPVASASTPCATPIIKYDGDNINISYPYSDETGITIYYTTDGSDPTTSSPHEESNSFNIPASGVVKVRAFAAKSDYVNSDEAVLWGSARPFLIQSMECADYYLVPAVNGTDVNTSSLPGTSMQWTLQNAGASTGGVPYYYLTNNNGNKVKYNTDFSLTMDTGTADANKFCVFENGYGTGYFFLIPVSQTDRVLYKDKGNVEANNCYAGLNKKWDTNLDQWNLIACNETADQKNLFSTAPFSVSNDDETHFYHIASVGQEGYYIVPPAEADGFATTSNTDYDDTPWMFKVAASDNWLTYYYIINAASGKYMYFNPNNNQTADQEKVISLKEISEKNAENEEKFQFIMVRSTTTGACYIVPKGYSYADASHKNFNANKYFGLWANESGPLKSTWSRITTGNHVKWTFAEATITDLYLNPVFSQDESGNITITHPTAACVIHYTIDGTDPSTSSAVYDNTNGLSSTEQCRIKAKAKLKTNSSIVSEVVTLLNMPDITLEVGPYTYKGTAWEPTVTKVSIGTSPNETTAPTEPVSYTASYSGDNINAGTTTATVTLTDADASDLWYIWNASQTFTINPALVTVTADDTTKEYGTDDPAWTATVTGMQNGESDTDLIHYTISRTESGEDVGGTYAIIPTGDAAQGNYSVSYVAGTLTIEPKAVTVTADNKTKTYGETDPALSVTIAGLVNGDTESVISYTISRAEGEAAGDYIITPTGEDSQGNYTVTYPTGMLTINKKDLTVTANNKTITYGETPANNGVTYGSFAFEDDENVLGGELTYTYNYAQYEDVGSGSFVITPSGLTSDNYDIDFVDGTLTVGQKEVGIGEWSNTTVTYNGSAQTPTATVDTDDLVNDDVIGVEVTVENIGVNAGSYTATATGLTGEKAGNYKLPDTPPTSSFTISPAVLYAINLSSTSFTYDGTEKTVTIASVTAGEGGALTVSSTDYSIDPSSTLSATNVGTYPVRVTANSTNYSDPVDPVEATFTIGKKIIGDGTDPATANGITIDITWNDNESEPPYIVEVKDGGTLLKEESEGSGYAYSLSAIGSHNTKYYTVTVTGANNYDGTFTAKYANVRFDSDGSPGAMWYGTFVAEADHVTPAGMTPYIITSVADNTATAVELDYIPNGVPVVLMNAEDAKGFLVQSGTGEISTTGNLLAVQATDEEKATATVYLLYKGEFVLNKAGTLKAGTVYLPVSAGGGSGARLKISRGGNTGIENIEYTVKPQSDAWYTLDGRRLSSKPTKKGLYLQGGKKIVVK